jgi:hypothetical protein
MEGECVSHERDEKCVQNISRKSWRERDHLGDVARWNYNIKMILKERNSIWRRGQVMGQWLAVVIMWTR